jgi:hypothetical protein
MMRPVTQTALYIDPWAPEPGDEEAEASGSQETESSSDSEDGGGLGAAARLALAWGEGADPDGDPAPARARRYRRGARASALAHEVAGCAPADGLPWGAAPHPLAVPRLLTAADPRAPGPPGFRGVLYPPQATLLAAMLALERRPLLAVEPGPGAPWAPLLQTKCGRVAERFSFGKTVVALALVCAAPAPAPLPELAPLPTYPLAGAAAARANRAFAALAAGGGTYDPAGAGFLPELCLRYARYLPLTLVAAAPGVITQWIGNVERFTALRYFVVENVRSLREFEALHRGRRLGGYDLLFVKAGRVTANFAVAGEARAPRAARRPPKNRSLFEALARVLEGVPVARLIVDDYDTLKLGSDDCFVPALFTWLISATRRQTVVRVRLRGGAPDAAGFLRLNAGAGFPVLGAALDDIANRVCSLRCAPEYADAHLGTTLLGFRQVHVRGGQAAAALRALDVPEEVVEMLNADAVGTAARALGIEARGIGDVLRRVVGTHLDGLRRAVRVAARVERARARLGPGRADAPPGEAGAGALVLRQALADGTDAEADAATDAAGAGCLAALDAWAAAQKEKYGKALARMQGNIREGHCQSCMLPFERGARGADAAYILAGCCQVLVCEPCVTRPGPGGAGFIRRCPNCARDVEPRTGLVRVGAELDLEEALADGAVLAADRPAAAPGPEAQQDMSPDAQLGRILNPKLRALTQLLLGRPVDCLRDIRVPPHIGGLLDGRRDAPWPADKPKKYLVFTVQPESCALIEAELRRLGVRHCVLRGTRAQRDEAVARLRMADGEAAVDVLLVSSAKDSAGLHLPFLSHVIFYHSVLDKNVEAQVTARGQRLGREHNLEVIALLNEFEARGP